jgi:restriction system protein
MSGRRPVPRGRSRYRRTKRRSQGGGLFLCLLVTALIALGLVVALVQWLLAHWLVLLAIVLAACVGGGVWWHRRAEREEWERARARALRYQLGQLDALHHSQFEHAVRDLMYRDGCQDAERVGGRGDLGADVKATDPFGRRWVIQCKHRRSGLAGSPVGTRDLQVVNGTARQIHGADVVVMVTNGRFTRDALPFGRSQRIHLVDRALLGQWAAGSSPLWELLGGLPAAPRRTPLS